MTTTELIQALVKMRKRYHAGWTLYDLQCDLEEIFDGLGIDDDDVVYADGRLDQGI